MLELKGISKYYNVGSVNEMCLFQDFNLNIEKGEFLSVVGSNGSGKTSMLNIICGSIPVESGQILIGDTDITKEKEYTNNLIKTDHEKTVLLQEVHHRVRNNLQIIMSFINLEKRFHKVNMKKLLILQKDVLDHLL